MRADPWWLPVAGSRGVPEQLAHGLAASEHTRQVASDRRKIIAVGAQHEHEPDHPPHDDGRSEDRD